MPRPAPWLQAALKITVKALDMAKGTIWILEDLTERMKKEETLSNFARTIIFLSRPKKSWANLIGHKHLTEPAKNINQA